MWFLTLVAIAVAVWLVLRAMRSRRHPEALGRETGGPADDGPGRPLPGQRAATDGEIEDAADDRTGGREDTLAGGRPRRDAAPIDTDTDLSGDDRDAGDGRAADSVGDVPDLPRERASRIGVDAESATGGASDGDTSADMHRVEASVRTQPPAAAADPSITNSPGDEDGPAERGRDGADERARDGTGGDAHGDADRDDAAGGDGRTASMSAATAARAAHDAQDTGGTGAAALAGTAIAAGAAMARDRDARARAGHGDDAGHDTADAARHEGDATSGHGTGDTTGHGSGDTVGHDAANAAGRGTDGSTEHGTEGGVRGGAGITNPPDPDTAGALELEGRGTDSAAALREDAAVRPGRADTSGATVRQVSTTAAPVVSGDAETASGQSVRDNAATNAPVADVEHLDTAARDAVDVPEANVAAAEPAATPESPEARVNAPDESFAGGLAWRDRSNGARSNLVAGTATLGVGGATVAPGASVLEDGRTAPAPAVPAGDGQVGDGGDAPVGADDGAPGHARNGHAPFADDPERLAGAAPREHVREMIKILNLAEPDASRLDVSKEDFARLRRGDADAPDALVDDVAARLRRMLG